ncbi:DUF190 domain-containing protein [Aerosticca soli]|uniref:Uncharacterized protein n=1 Tax=Aerosticca soli TaxID=2010829 RepID=A0A2Z6E5H7_9GAMM|nr:DUF190 domain-containing protein [Aerosticca soli]MDI3261759.1 DUF190 domain-containing protein [Fulvimonas sp.]BBD79778.1 hypothetical protein ALSL_1115 [Aerosticca soli]
MQGYSLRFYMHENQRHAGMLLYEWLLEQARQRGIHGGCAFRAIAGYGRHGQLHEAHFFELAGEATVLVEFIAPQEETQALLAWVQAARVPLFWARLPVEFGVSGQA